MKRAGFVLLAVLACATPAHAQNSAPGLLAAIGKDLDEVEAKFVGLAEAIPADKWDWRPGAGVRSIREVFLHVASDNYLLPIPLGVAAPAETGIVGTDFESAVRFEKRALGKPEAIAAMKASFAHLDGALEATDEASLGGSIQLFGSPSTRHALWFLTAVHLHEHLGQMIAYARSNGVVPPWSR